VVQGGSKDGRRGVVWRVVGQLEGQGAGQAAKQTEGRVSVRSGLLDSPGGYMSCK
jgi:hypothetical protein